MRIEVLGDGPPEVAVVGGIHGDEPCGVRAVEHLLASDLSVRRPVAFVVANEEAVDRGVRYVEEDLNRAFPPLGVDHDEFAFSNTHEGRLARRMYDRLEDCLSLAIHSTRSYPHPFSVVVDPDAEQLDVCARLPTDLVVDSTAIPDGRFLEACPAVEVEAGYQGSQAATDDAIDVARAFLAATGVIDGPAVPGEKSLFRVRRPIPKRAGGGYDVFVRNFERVPAGEPFAAVDGELVYAEREFYPVLLSSHGYRDLFGYEADRAGTITPEGGIVEDVITPGAAGSAADQSDRPVEGDAPAEGDVQVEGEATAEKPVASDPNDPDGESDD
ncbi:succinylglutamate desuccinylase [Halobacteriales archaeon QS_8_69_26]|nr:MAG: succinylglutamate desuccinylase [Halobacteriales archaeon QS_8_69_26]